MSISKIVLIVVVVVIVLFLLASIYSLSPTVKDVSEEPPLKPFIKQALVLKKDCYLFSQEKGQYSIIENVLVSRNDYPGKQILELPIGSVIIINQFKTYRNNLGSGFTHLLALGKILNNDKQTLPFEYYMGTVDKELYSETPYKLPYTVWQDSNDVQIDLTKK